MIDPGLLGAVGPIILGAGVGLAARKVISIAEDRHADAVAATAAAAAAPRPRIRPAVPAGGRR